MAQPQPVRQLSKSCAVRTKCHNQSETRPFGVHTARKLMAVGRDLRLRKREHVLALPPSWGTLYVLPKLDDEQWKTGIAGRSHRSPLSRASAPRPDQSGAERDDVAGDEAHRDHRAPFGQAEIGRANPQGLGCGVGVLLDAIALSVKLVVGGLPVSLASFRCASRPSHFGPRLAHSP